MEAKQFKPEEFFIKVPKSKVVNLPKTIGNCVKSKLTDEEIEEVKNAVIAFNTELIESNN